MFRSKEYVDWMEECKIIAAKEKFPKIKGKYKLMIRVCRPDKRRRDIDNVCKAASDFLQHAGIVEDDCLCEAIYCRWVTSGPPVRINVYSTGGTDELFERTSGSLQGRTRKNGTGGNTAGKSPSQIYAELVGGKKARTRKGGKGRSRS